MASVPASRSAPPPPPVWTNQASAQASVAFGPPAGFWVRFVAVLIDSLVVTLPIIAVGAVVGGVIGYSGTGEDEAVVIAIIVFAVILPIAVIASWLYEALMTSSRRGATLGKRALGLRVIKDDGTQLGFGRATGRHFAKVLITSMVPLAIGYVMAAFTERKRALHDMIANTLVIKDVLGRTDFQREAAMTNVPSPGRVAPPPPVWDAHPAEAGVQHYAGFWLRVAAYIVDAIALAILSQIIALFFPALPPPPRSIDIEVFWQYWLASLPPGKMAASTLLSWAYFALQESSSAQATIGKRLVGIRVSTEDGARLGLGAATIRAWPLYLSCAGWIGGPWLGGLASLASLVACLSVAFSSRKQGLHDKMAGAVLVRR